MLHNYAMAGQTMEVLTSIKYLRVDIRGDLKWNDHLKSVVDKADARQRFIGRISRKCSLSTKEVGYKMLVWLALE